MAAKTPKLLLVHWHDAVSAHSGWKSEEDVKKQEPAIVRSVGWEMKRTKRFLTIAASLVDGDCDGDVTIPLGMIFREQEITP